MARDYYYEVAEIFKKDYPTFIVCPPETHEEAMSVYPPKDYHDDQGIDVFIDANTAEFWCDGQRVGRMLKIESPAAVAEFVVTEHNNYQKYLEHENNS